MLEGITYEDNIFIKLNELNELNELNKEKKLKIEVEDKKTYDKKTYDIILGELLTSQELFELLKGIDVNLEGKLEVEEVELEEVKDEAISAEMILPENLIKGKESFDPIKKESFDPIKIRNILLIGRTGNGKSALANVIAGVEKFKESDLGVSETKDAQAEVVEIGGFGYRIVDTIGIGDTNLGEKEVLIKIAQATRIVKEGLNQVLFVAGGRFTEEEIEAYNILRTVIFNQDIVRYTTVVRTKFSSFQLPKRTEKDKEKLIAENDKLADVISRCNKVLYVDNPSIDTGDEERNALNRKVRGYSRKLLLTHLIGCEDVYKPENFDRINERIGKHVDEKQNLADSINDLKKQLKEQKNLSEQERNQLMEQLNVAKEQNGGVNEKILGELRDQLKIQSEEYLRKIDEIGKQSQDEINRIKEEYSSQIQEFREKEKGDGRNNQDEINRIKEAYRLQIQGLIEENKGIRARQEQASQKGGSCTIL